MKSRAALVASLILIVACKSTSSESSQPSSATAEVPAQPSAPAKPLAPAPAPAASASAAPVDPASERSCSTDADCGWGEIKKEILSKADCPCLFGCPYLPHNKTTLERRQSQYKKLCTPGKGGADDSPCPIDDCMPPKVAHCNSGVCGK